MSQAPRPPVRGPLDVIRLLIVGAIIMGIAWLLGVWNDNVRDTENGAPAIIAER